LFASHLVKQLRALMPQRTTPNSMFGTADQLMVSVLLASADLSISTHRHLEALFQRSIKMMTDTGLAFMLVLLVSVLTQRKFAV